MFIAHHLLSFRGKMTLVKHNNSLYDIYFIFFIYSKYFIEQTL